MSDVTFITQNPASQAFQQETDFQNKQRDIQQGRLVDQAIRQGVGDMLNQQQPSAPPAPSVASPTTDNTPTPGFTPAVPTPVKQEPLPTIGPAANTSRLESGGNPGVVNPQGFSGKYQLGKASLIDAGIYQPSAGESAYDQKNWTGTFNVPGFGSMSYQQWLSSGPAQDATWNAHVAQMDREIQQRGLGSYVGQTIGGVPITQDSLRGMIQGGGPSGTEMFLRTGGNMNPADANGTTIADFGRRIGGFAPGGTAPSAPPGVPPATIGPAATTAAAQPVVASPTLTPPNRFAPILNRLQNVPGGGAVAMKLLGEQAQLDRYQLARQEQYQHLAMMAFNRGDMDVGRYYAQLGGISIPEQVLGNVGQRQRLTTGALLAQRLYRSDPQAGARFTRAYMATGDVGQALATAGEPQMPGTKRVVQWVDDGQGHAKGVLVDPTGQSPAEPIIGPDGQQVIRAQGVAASGRIADRQLRLQMLKNAGYDDQTANMIAAGAVPSPNSMVSAYTRVQQMISNDFTIPDDQKAARVADTMGQMFGPDWLQRVQGRLPQPGQAPTIGPNAPPPEAAQPQQSQPVATPTSPGAPGGPVGSTPPRPPTVPPGSQYSPSRKMWRDPQGNFYDASGSPFAAPGAAPTGPQVPTNG